MTLIINPRIAKLRLFVHPRSGFGPALWTSGPDIKRKIFDQILMVMGSSVNRTVIKILGKGQQNF